jgi:VWFA-related protein
VLVIVTDGVDNASAATRDQIEKAAEARATAIFAVGVFGRTEHAGEGRHELDRVTERTGGSAFYPPNVDDIDSVALKIAREIRSQYTIGYTPLNQALDGTYRSIRVAVAAKEKMTVQARTGYRATPGS